jgi:hypothetical protein
MDEQCDPASGEETPEGATDGVAETALAVRAVVEFANSALTPAQALAVRALTEGMSLNDAARAAGVERITLYRWRTRNPQFIAAMNAWRREQLEHGQEQFVLLRDAALDAVRQGLARGDARLGMAALDRMGVSAIAEARPTLPSRIDGPEIEQPEAELAWRELEGMIAGWPQSALRLLPDLFHFGTRIANAWGMEMIEELATEYRARRLTAEQAKRVPDIILMALDAEAALLEHGGAGDGQAGATEGGAS